MGNEMRLVFQISEANESGTDRMESLLFFFGKRLPLDGLWERHCDDFAGCILKVGVEESERIGRIVSVPESMIESGWSLGDLKWRNIHCDANGVWRVQDLRKHYDMRKHEVTRVDFAPYCLSLGVGGRLRLHEGRWPLFPAQKWKRIG